MTVAALAGAAALAHTAQPSIALAADDLTLRIIVLGSAGEAERVVEKLERGENFVTLARTESIDPTADSGGLLGRVSLATLRPELRDALRDVGVGQLTRVVRVPTGFAILKVVPDEEAGNTAAPPPNDAVSATGSVKYVFTVAGLGEAQASLIHFPKPDDWNQDPRTICALRTQSVAAMQSSIESALSPAPPASRCRRPVSCRRTMAWVSCMPITAG